MSIISFLKENRKVLIVGSIGFVLGVIVNILIKNYENSSFLGSLNEELLKLQEKSKTNSLTIEEQKQLDTLKEEIYIMKFKCAI